MLLYICDSLQQFVWIVFPPCRGKENGFLPLSWIVAVRWRTCPFGLRRRTRRTCSSLRMYAFKPCKHNLPRAGKKMLFFFFFLTSMAYKHSTCLLWRPSESTTQGKHFFNRSPFCHSNQVLPGLGACSFNVRKELFFRCKASYMIGKPLCQAVCVCVWPPICRPCWMEPSQMYTCLPAFISQRPHPQKGRPAAHQRCFPLAIQTSERPANLLDPIFRSSVEGTRKKEIHDLTASQS